MSSDISRADPSSLAPLMGLTDDSRGRWSADELAAILRHQLEAPLLFDLKTIDTGGRFTLDRQTCWVDGMPLHTFGDLFSHPHPPIELLLLTKDFAKTSDARQVSPLPPEVATVLYYGAILVARLRCDQDISRLSMSQISEGIAWILRQPWLDDKMRGLFEQSAALLSKPITSA